MLKRSLLTVLLLSTVAVFAQVDEQRHIHTDVGEHAITADCNGGVKYDDGSFQDAYQAGSSGLVSMVMKFDLPAGTTTLDQVCSCFTRLSTATPSTMNYEVVIYNDNGAGGAPGTLVAAIPVSASGLQVIPSVSFANANVTSSGIVLPDNTVYVGARWPVGNIFMCGDRSAGTAQRSNYYSTNSGASWTSMASFTSPPRALGIRVDTGSGTTPNCTPTTTAMCLNANRFKVEATWQSSSSSGVGNVTELTDDTGYFWFFSPSNVEVVVKVLNGCGANARYWVFSAGLTDVRVTLTVTDTKTGSVRQYINPQGTAYAPVQDTSAFATCP